MGKDASPLLRVVSLDVASQFEAVVFRGSRDHPCLELKNTAGNSGIGVETVRSLCKAGYTVVLACRNTAKGDAVQKELEIEEGRHIENDSLILVKSSS